MLFSLGSFETLEGCQKADVGLGEANRKGYIYTIHIWLIIYLHHIVNLLRTAGETTMWKEIMR